MLYPYRELTITSKVQEFCGREFAAKLGAFDYNLHLYIYHSSTLNVYYSLSQLFNSVIFNYSAEEAYCRICESFSV